MRLHRLMPALLAFCVHGALVAAEDDGSWAGHSFAKREFAEKCASCHGPKAKGDGVNKPLLDHSPPDLTVLAKTHGGEFPYDEFYTAVDGRVAEHTDMPCFANIYMEASRSDYMDVPYDEDRYMDTRLVALANYVNALQER